jgi:hypothetical protein
MQQSADLFRRLLRSGMGDLIGQIRGPRPSKYLVCDRAIHRFADPPLQGPRSRDGVGRAGTVTVGTAARRAVATLLLAAAVLILAYWKARYAHRSLVASETTITSTQFEGAFPLADTAGSPSACSPAPSAS